MSSGEGAGAHITITLDQSYTIYKMRICQRWSGDAKFKDLQLSFSDGSQQTVSDILYWRWHAAQQCHTGHVTKDVAKPRSFPKSLSLILVCRAVAMGLSSKPLGGFWQAH